MSRETAKRAPHGLPDAFQLTEPRQDFGDFEPVWIGHARPSLLKRIENITSRGRRAARPSYGAGRMSPRKRGRTSYWARNWPL